jgi:hypothetical protein
MMIAQDLAPSELVISRLVGWSQVIDRDKTRAVGWWFRQDASSMRR